MSWIQHILSPSLEFTFSLSNVLGDIANPFFNLNFHFNSIVKKKINFVITFQY